MTETINDIFIYSGERSPVYLEQTTGEVIPYEDEEIPNAFKIPLKKSESITSTKGIASGNRTALVETDGKVYKLKGIIPTNKRYQIEDVPYGCLKETASLNELRASKVMHEFGLKNGIEAPLKPVCYFKYDINFQGEPVSCCVQEARGDDRLEYQNNFSNIIEKAFNKNLRNRNKIDDLREQLTNRIGNWMGFWYGSLERANLCWGSTFFSSKFPETNVGVHNIIIYPVNGGVGVGLIDLDRSDETCKIIKEFELEHIRKNLSCFDGMLYFLENGKKAEYVCRYLINQIGSALSLEMWKDGVDPFDGMSLPKEDELDIIKYFEKGRKGDKPLPIDKEFFTDREKKIMSILK
jgi:hypothetical protein